jgi:hypothetical protein
VNCLMKIIYHRMSVFKYSPGDIYRNFEETAPVKAY